MKPFIFRTILINLNAWYLIANIEESLVFVHQLNALIIQATDLHRVHWQVSDLDHSNQVLKND